MRLGMPILRECKTPEAWITALQQLGCSAAYYPLNATAGADEVRAYAEAAQKADILIAEVGAWSNPISPDEETRQAAIALNQRQLALAEQIGARCCVNIAGSRSTAHWDAPHPDNLSEETFHLIVETVREIIDAVQPTRTFYTLEAMPWVFPDTPESYLRLIKAIDRPRFAVHLDPVNWISSPQLYFSNSALLRECFAVLGPWIKSCHAKDVRLSDTLTVHLDEACPGQGDLDYHTLLAEMARLDPDTPLMLEHMGAEQDYVQGADYIRSLL
ncbi:MAG TPA: sugar phosphate isomerase/epimerase family protein [Ktedonobacteraceae bacterium]